MLRCCSYREASELRVAHGRGLVVEIGNMRQDGPAGDQRIADDADRPSASSPSMKLAQERQVVAADVVPDQNIGLRQMREPVVNLSRSIFVNLIAIKIADDNTMHRGHGV